MSQYQIEILDGSQQKWDVQEYINIGKDNTCGVQVFDPLMCERHARLELKNSQLLIKDLRSTTGTFINGAQILEAVLKDGDLLTLGQTDFVVHDSKHVKKEFSLTSKCEYWKEQLDTLGPVGQTKYPVLLLGPSGTGKDVIAHAIHDVSRFSEAPFVSVNCSALTETLVESELFGHIKGSFTGAIADRKGAFESARGGTLFLDEIGDLTYGLQAKLLRALENNEIRPVGSDRSVKTEVRIIAATHQNLYQKIREGSFRSDLFYRLNVITVETPALKDRLEDFDELLYTFARQMKVRFSFNAIQALKKHDWPGNIRELRNVVARASALYPKKYIEESHIDTLLNKKERLAHLPTGVNYAVTGDNNQMSVIKEIEKQMILKRLAANNGNQKRTAIDLGMPKSTLHDRIRTYDIDIDQFKS